MEAPSYLSSQLPVLLPSLLILVLSLLLMILPCLLHILRHHVVRGRDVSSRKKRLPPGSMGWPLVGETLRLFERRPGIFFSDRQRRHGDVFKTHILGCPCVVVSSGEAIRSVLVTRAHLFKPTFPPSKERMIGPGALNFHRGPYHSTLKNLVRAALLPCSLKGAVPDVEKLVLAYLPTWENKSINTHTEMKKFAFDVAMLAAFGGCGDLEKESIRELYSCVHEGYNSMPFNLPGFPFYKAMKARKHLGELIREIITKRRHGKQEGGGLLGVLLRSRDQNIRQLTDTQLVDNIFGVLFGAQDTTASVLTWLLKYLHDNRNLLDLVVEEQENVRQERMKGNRGLTWDDMRSMRLTNRVIQETMRAASVLGFTYREAVEDVELQGYLVPRGWKVLPLFVGIHHCAEFFPEPDKFDPARFEVPLRPNTFMPFGNGVHSCPGNELAKLEILVLLHHFLTKFRWTVLGKKDGIQYSPFPVPKHGLPIQVTPREAPDVPKHGC